MAVDKSYGSGKSRSAANSAARRRVAAGNFTKGKKGNATLRKIAKDNPVTGFVGGGVALGTLSKVAAGLSKAGRVSQSLSVADRAYAKATGQELGRSIAISRKEPIGAYNRSTSNQGIENLKEFRGLSRDIFPKATKTRGPDARLQSVANKIYTRHLSDVRTKGLGHGDAVSLPRAGVLRNLKEKRGVDLSLAKMRAEQKLSKGTRVTELEKRLNLPGKAPKRGR
jgi:hypothetical protein